MEIAKTKNSKECKECGGAGESVKSCYFYNATGKARYKNLCTECKKELCPKCGEKVPHGVAGCAQCQERDDLIKAQYALKNAQFEIDYQTCRCGKVNDSRTQGGVLTSRFCTSCRKKYGRTQYSLRGKIKDAYAIAAPMEEKSSIVFDKTIGYKYRG